jgi:hypothetical protein
LKKFASNYRKEPAQLRNRIVTHAGETDASYPYIIPSADESNDIAINKREPGPFSQTSYPS